MYTTPITSPTSTVIYFFFISSSARNTQRNAMSSQIYSGANCRRAIISVMLNLLRLISAW